MMIHFIHIHNNVIHFCDYHYHLMNFHSPKKKKKNFLGAQRFEMKDNSLIW